MCVYVSYCLTRELVAQLQGVPNMRPEIIIAECNGFIRPDLKAKLGPELAKLNMQQSLLIFRSLSRSSLRCPIHTQKQT